MKDAKGHGSESRGGVFTREAARGFAKRIGAGASHQVGVNSVPTNPTLGSPAYAVKLLQDHQDFGVQMRAEGKSVAQVRGVISTMSRDMRDAVLAGYRLRKN
jgi:hypothetical protein